MISNFLYVCCLSCIAWTDWKTGKIKSGILILMMLIRCMSLWWLWLRLPEQGICEMRLALEGFLFNFCGFLLLYGHFKGGLGGGDVKLFAVLGYCYGAERILYLLFFTFFFAAIAGISMTGMKKRSKNQTLPLAPFALLAVFLQMIGGFI
jgi:leader peptidase (prepilin peptidase)/N-methyltransferase